MVKWQSLHSCTPDRELSFFRGTFSKNLNEYHGITGFVNGMIVGVTVLHSGHFCFHPEKNTSHSLNQQENTYFTIKSQSQFQSYHIEPKKHSARSDRVDVQSDVCTVCILNDGDCG